MQVQPFPCPFDGIKCRELQVQTRTKDTVQWKRRCLECGREIVTTQFAQDQPVREDARMIKRPLDLRRAADRWVATEKRNRETGKRHRRKKHAAQEG